MNILWFVLIFAGIIFSCNGLENKARYDNYRIYRVKLKTDEHVKLFQDIEHRSDSYEFYGHARQKDTELTILVAAHKIAEMTDFLKTRNVEHVILVNVFCNHFNLKVE